MVRGAVTNLGAGCSAKPPIFLAKYPFNNYEYESMYILYRYKLAAPRIFFFWPAFVTRLLTPGHENPAMGFFRGVDQD